jgi:acetyl esterase/lipase
MNDNLKDIPYAAQSDAQKLDIYVPPGASGPYPVVVWLHPGGFTMGDKDMVKPFLKNILAAGYAVVSVNYRLADEAQSPAQIFDAKAAVRWVRANAENYNFNPEKIIAWGVSAGSTFAALLGTSANVESTEDLSMGNPGESSRVSAVVDIIGPMDFLQMDPQLVRLGYPPLHDNDTSGESILIGGQLSKFPERCRAINPATYITPDCPPFFLQHGKADDLVPYLQSVELAEKLTAVIGPENVTLNLIENADHFDAAHNSPENVKKVFDFLDRHLGK